MRYRPAFNREMDLVNQTKRPLALGWKIARPLVVAGLVGLMLLALYQNRQSLAGALGAANWGYLAAALVIGLGGSLLYVGVWHSCARQLGASGGYGKILAALSVAGAARYVPGGIWPVAGLVYFGPYLGLSRKIMPGLALLSQFLHMLAAVIAGVLGLFFILLIEEPGDSASTVRVEFAGALGLGLALATVGLLPRYLRPLLGRIWKVELTFNLWPPAACSFLFWVSNGVRLWLLALAFGPVAPSVLPIMIAIGAATTLVGVIFFFVPGGLGVVEFSLAALAGLILPWPQVIALVTLNRLMRILNDLLFLGLASGSRLWQRRKKAWSEKT